MANKRINFVLFLFIMFSAVLIHRLFYLQIQQHDFYLALAKGQRINFEEIKGERGKIFFQDKDNQLYPVAINKDFNFVFICPNEISEKEQVAQILSENLNIDKDYILKLLKKDSLFELIEDDVEDEIVEKIKEQEIKGIYFDKRRARFYPYGKLASKILGFVDIDNNGKYGLEGFYNKVLKGKKGLLEEERGLGGNVMFFDIGRFIPAKTGVDLVSTIDYNIQYQAEKLLKKVAEDLSVKSGIILVINPQNGEIKALANMPNFNPNTYFDEEISVFQNDAVEKIFEPGSIFKPFTMSTALDLGRVEPDSTYVDKGVLQFNGGIIYNYSNRVYGEQTMTNVLEKSINTGAVFAQQQAGEKNFIDYFKKFGFEQQTEIDLPGEIASKNKYLKSGRDINLVTAAFGQGIEVTPIQIVQGFSALINGGNIWRPHLIKKIIDQDGNEQIIEPKIEKSLVIKRETSEKIVEMLVSVTENGFGKKARVPGYYIGGKTGTAQVPWSVLGIDKAGYSDETIQSFVGFFPAYDPQFLILVKLDNPETRTAEYSAIPIFQELADYIIKYHQIAPNH